MPLFLMIGGFLTAVLVHNRSLNALVSHRSHRIFLPLLLGLDAIVPITNWLNGLPLNTPDLHYL